MSKKETEIKIDYSKMKPTDVLITHGSIPKYEDFTNKRFGHWTALYEIRRGTNRMMYCRCDCGTEKFVTKANLRSGDSKSCGCELANYVSAARKQHGMSKTDIYHVFCGMKRRCNNKNETEYKNYGGRGIRVCEEWQNNFVKFYEWAIRTGYKKGLQIDRIDVNGNYSPDNCRWVTPRENSLNRRNTVYFTIDGEKKLLIDFAKENNILPQTVYAWYERHGEDYVIDRIKSFNEKHTLEYRNERAIRVREYCSKCKYMIFINDDLHKEDTMFCSIKKNKLCTIANSSEKCSTRVLKNE